MVFTLKAKFVKYNYGTVKTAIFAVNGDRVLFQDKGNGCWESDRFTIRWMVDEWICRFK